MNLGSFSFQSDLYSFGVILYELYTGVTPYFADSKEKIINLIHTENIDWHALSDTHENIKKFISSLL